MILPAGITEANLREASREEQTPWLHVVGRIQKDTPTATHYVELARPTHPTGSRYIHRYLEAVHTEIYHSPQSIPVCPSEIGHHRSKRANLVGLDSISEQSHPFQSLSSVVALSQSFPICTFITRK